MRLILILTIIMIANKLSCSQTSKTEYKMGYAKINNAEIYYEIHGAGKPLLLISGLASDSQSWFTVLEELSKQYKVVVFDNRCSGRTKSNENEISIPMMANEDRKSVV